MVRGALVAVCVASLLVMSLGEMGETHSLEGQDPADQREAAQQEDNAQQGSEAAKQGDKSPFKDAPPSEADAKPEKDSSSADDKVDHIRAHAKHKEKHSKATGKVKELEQKLGIHNGLPKASAQQVDKEYNKYATNEREKKRNRRFPRPANKEQAVKRVYEIMHKNKDVKHHKMLRQMKAMGF